MLKVIHYDLRSTYSLLFMQESPKKCTLIIMLVAGRVHRRAYGLHVIYRLTVMFFLGNVDVYLEPTHYSTTRGDI
jgi:hypothetical protein